ncbi:MAG: hypothetical protein WC675_03385 [Patescibacteria group bacterium]|jgi:hypothetical protein
MSMFWIWRFIVLAAVLVLAWWLTTLAGAIMAVVAVAVVLFWKTRARKWLVLACLATPFLLLVPLLDQQVPEVNLPGIPNLDLGVEVSSEVRTGPTRLQVMSQKVGLTSGRNPLAASSDKMSGDLLDIDQAGKRLELIQAGMTDFELVELKPFFRKDETTGEFVRDPKVTPPVYRNVIEEVVDEQSGEKKKVWKWIVDPTFEIRPDLPLYASFRLTGKTGMSANMVPIEQYQPDSNGVWLVKRGEIRFDTIQKVVEQPNLAASVSPPATPKEEPPQILPASKEKVAAAPTSSSIAKATWPTKPHPKTDTVTVKPGNPDDLDSWTWSKVIADQGDRFKVVFDKLPKDYRKIQVRQGSFGAVALHEIHQGESGKWESNLVFEETNRPEAPLGLMVVNGSEVNVEIRPAVG